MAAKRAETIHAETHTTTHAANGAVGARPGVEVYDNTSPSTTQIMHDEERLPGTTYSVSTPSDTGTVTPATNWTSIIVGILMVLALILLIMWLL